MSKSQIIENKKFGYFDPREHHGNVRMNSRQIVSGFPVGILYIADADYPMMPGNVNNGWTYDYPVILRSVDKITQKRVFEGDPTLVNDLIDMAQYLVQKEGVRAISSGCGFFGNFQKQVSAAVDVPVAMSPLVMVPWISALIKPNQKIGIITANKAAMTPQLFESCGITDPDRLVIEDLYYKDEISCVVHYRGQFNNDIATQEVVEAAMAIMDREDEIGAFVLECSDLPPYSYAIQMATQRPVFDFISVIDFLVSSVTKKPYSGWL